MTRLFDYFGLIGIGSILTWVAALTLVGVYAFHKPMRRPMIPRVALVVAFVSLVLGLVNSANVDAIEAIREEAPSQEPEVKSKTLETMKRRRDEINMPDGTPSEPIDKPGGYDYRQRGKVERDSSASLGQPPPTDGAGSEEASKATTKPAGAATQPTTKPAAEPRRMPGIDVSRANRYDGLNQNAIRLTLVLIVLTLIYDFLRRLNQTAEGVVTLPITGDWLDTIAPKSRAAWVVSSKPATLARSLAAHVARKGESFVMVGGDPFPSRLIPATTVGTHACKLPVMTFGPGCEPYPDRFLAESVSFRRAGIVTRDIDSATRLFRAFDALVKNKNLPARAPRTVNIIWAGSPTTLAELAHLIETSEERNIKVVVVSAERPTADNARLFNETSSIGDAMPRAWCEPIAQVLDSLLTWMFGPKPIRAKVSKPIAKATAV